MDEILICITDINETMTTVYLYCGENATVTLIGWISMLVNKMLHRLLGVPLVPGHQMKL